MFRTVKNQCNSFINLNFHRKYQMHLLLYFFFQKPLQMQKKFEFWKLIQLSSFLPVCWGETYGVANIQDTLSQLYFFILNND